MLRKKRINHCNYQNKSFQVTSRFDITTLIGFQSYQPVQLSLIMKTVTEMTNKNEVNEDSNIWSSILDKVQRTGTKKLPSNKNLLVLGDNESGKTSLIAKMAGVDTPKKGSGLEYNYLEIRDEYRDESTKLGVWILDGEKKHENLLNFALTESNFENSCCLLVATMSQPWNIMNSLEEWTNVLERHIDSLNIKSSSLKHYKHSMLRRFINYVSPGDEVESRLVAGSRFDSKSDFYEGDSMNEESQDDDGIRVLNQTEADLIPFNELPETTLSRNLGIEIIVVITKTDFMSNLEKDYDYTEESFDFIQQAIRKFCLKIGASLFYVSAKVNKNCDLLYKFISHRIYSLPFNTPALVVEKDAIFVPAGWDNEKKISILYENIRNANPDDEYNNYILDRASTKPTQRDAEVIAEDDQVFLSRMQSLLSKQTSSPRETMARSNNATPSPVPPRIESRRSVGSTGSNIQGLEGAANSPAGEGVLQNFFNSLLSRGRTMPPGSPLPTIPQTPHNINNKSP